MASLLYWTVCLTCCKTRLVVFRHLCGRPVTARPLWAVLLHAVLVVGRLSGGGTVPVVAAWCCRRCFECCTRCGPGSACVYTLKSRWQCTQLRGHYSRCVGTPFPVGSGSPVGRCGMAVLGICPPSSMVVAVGPLLRVLHSPCTGSVISGAYSRSWPYLIFVSTLGMPWCSGLDFWAAVCVGVLDSGKAALCWAWLLLSCFCSIAPCVCVRCCVCVGPPVPYASARRCAFVHSIRSIAPP